MPWVKLDDQFHAHPKLSGLGALTLPAVGLHVIALTWCSHYLTDGFVPHGQVRKFAGTKRLTDALVSARLWEAVDGGFRIHDYLAYNPSREKVLVQRESEAERKRKGRTSGERPATVRPDSARPVPTPVPVPVPSLSSESEHARIGDDVTALVRLIEEKTRRPWSFGPGSRAFETLRLDVRDFGAQAVGGAISAADDTVDAAVLVFDAHKLLVPMRSSRSTAEAERERRQREDEERIRRETEATRRRNAALYGPEAA